MKKNIKEFIEEILSKDKRLWNEESKEFNQILLLDLVEKTDEKVISLLLQETELREKFFVKIKDVYVFKTNDFRFFIEENKVDNSFTDYKNRIGLTDGKKFLKDTKDVVLDFPYKDCILEGGQSSEEGKDTYFEWQEEKLKDKLDENGNKIKDGRKNVKEIDTPAHYEEKQEKRKEVFLNRVLADSEIDRLLDNKALTNLKRVSGENKEQKLKEFKKNDKGEITDNLLIKGNNLLALHSLKEKFAGRVKLIYIDPPYNTGNDGFKYNDNFNHSTWLTFMKNRLEVAKELLRDDGVIFVQCDDNEQAYLKVMMDDILGRENTETMIWHKVGDDSGRLKITKRFRREHEYIVLGYKNKNKTYFNKYLSDRNYKNSYTNPDNDLRGVYKQGIISHTEEISKKTGKNFYDVKTPSGRIVSRQWRVTEKEFEELRNDNRIYFGKKGDSIPSLKVFINEKKETTPVSILSELGTAKSAGINLIKLFDTKLFNYPKPENYLKRIIEISTKPKDIVLDFFAGSGTTPAVAHKMGRQWIAIEQMDYIETITKKRLEKVIDGEQGGISKAVSWSGGGDFVYCELAEWNEKAKEKILKCNNLKELEVFFNDEMYENYFLNYNLKINHFKEVIIKEENFKKLSLDEQKKMFITMLDNNQMYINKTEMEDTKFALSKEDQKLTNMFYEEEK